MSHHLIAPSYDDIIVAADNIREKSIKTPIVKLNWDYRKDVNIYLKLENIQQIGSFKGTFFFFLILRKILILIKCLFLFFNFK